MQGKIKNKINYVYKIDFNKERVVYGMNLMFRVLEVDCFFIKRICIYYSFLENI